MKAMKRAAKDKTITDLTGWILVCKDEDSPEWHIAWQEPFATKRTAIRFATENNWWKPYRAVRGRLMVDPV
jgi:hypothetical protein